MEAFTGDAIATDKNVRQISFIIYDCHGNAGCVINDVKPGYRAVHLTAITLEQPGRQVLII